MPHRDRGDSPRSFVCAKIRTPSRMKALDTERRSDPPPLPLLQVAPVFYAAPRSLGKSGRRSRILPIYARFYARKVPAEASKRRLTEKFLSFLILRWTKPLFADSIIRKGTEGSKAPRRVCASGFFLMKAQSIILTHGFFLSSREVTPRNSRYCASVGLRINRDRGAAARKMRKKIPPVKGRR